MNPLLFFIPLFAVLDRWYGGGLPLRIAGHGLGKPASLLVIPACLLMGIPLIGAIGLTVAWLAYRSPAWKLFGGDLAPRRGQYPGTLARHAIAPVAFILALCVLNQAFSVQYLAFLVFPPVALLLAIYNRKQADKGRDANGLVEYVRGAVLGGCLVAALI